MIEVLAAAFGFIGGILFMIWINHTADSQGIKAVIRQGHYQAALEAGRERERMRTLEQRLKLGGGYDPRAVDSSQKSTNVP